MRERAGMAFALFAVMSERAEALMEASSRCLLCGGALALIHGQGVCVRDRCPLKLQPQVGCCEGERAENLAPPDDERR